MALSALKALRALPVYPVFANGKSNGSDKKSDKKDHSTNIIATNFVWEQLEIKNIQSTSVKTEKFGRNQIL